MELNFMGQPIADPGQVGIGIAMLGIIWTFTGLAILVVALRMYLRRRFLGHWTAEDWCMMGALVLQVAGQSIFTYGVSWGIGKEYANLSLDSYMQVQKSEYIIMSFTVMVELLARAAITILLVRIFGITRAWFKWFAIALTVSIWLTGIVGMALFYAQVRPVAAFWDPRIKPDYKMSQYVNADATLVFQLLIALSDLLFVVLPVAFVWNVKMPLQRKVALVLLLSASLVTTGVQSAKCGLAIRGMMGKIVFQEAGYIGAVFYIVTWVEQAVVIIMGCLPTLGPITKLDLSTIPLLGSIGRSLNSLLSRRDRRSGKGSSDGGNSISYQKESEMGHLSAKNSKQSMGSGGHTDSESKIRRVDEIEVLRSTDNTTTINPTLSSFQGWERA